MIVLELGSAQKGELCSCTDTYIAGRQMTKLVVFIKVVSFSGALVGHCVGRISRLRFDDW